MTLSANYEGDCRDSVGRMMGPDQHECYYEVTHCDYDGSRSKLYFKPVNLRTDTRYHVRDGFGQPYLIA